VVFACICGKRLGGLSFISMNTIVSDGYVSLYPIKKTDASIVRMWYEQADNFGYATGGKNPDEILNILISQQNQTTVCGLGGFPCFVLGIYPFGRNNCIGLIVGEIKTLHEPVLWLRTCLVDTAWQRKHFGTRAFNLLSDYIAKNYNIKRIIISVHSQNQAGKLFWESLGFICVQALKAKCTENKADILIYEKVIKP
jgi:RimJ/RimL family protein N-acetyltransferase